MPGFSNWIMFSNPRVKLICSLDTDNAYILKSALKKKNHSEVIVQCLLWYFQDLSLLKQLFLQLENLNIKFLAITFPPGQDEFQVFKCYLRTLFSSHSPGQNALTSKGAEELNYYMKGADLERMCNLISSHCRNAKMVDV